MKRISKPRLRKPTDKQQIKRYWSQVQYTSSLTPEEKKEKEKNPLFLSERISSYRTSCMTMHQAIEIYMSCRKPNQQFVKKDIFQKCPEDFIGNVEKIRKKVMKIMPSLSGQLEYRLGIEGQVPDPGKVCQGIPECMLTKKPSPQLAAFKSGATNFRIVICTDNIGGGSSSCSALMAMSSVIRMIAPCQFVVQQGWLTGFDMRDTRYGNNSNGSARNGGTVNLINLPDNMDASLLWFWCNSQYKDSSFSGTIARELGSRYSGVSRGPEIPCDLYMQDDHLRKVRSILTKMGLKNIDSNDVAAFWISKLVSEKFTGKEMLDNPEIMQYLSECL